MQRVFILAAAALAAILPTIAMPSPAEAQHTRRAATTDWTRQIVQTPEGGYRMGNPDAALKVVEYGSITCGHCADFANASKAGLRERVRTGRVSFEFRPYWIFPSDPGLFMMMRCQTPRQAFATIEHLFTTHDTWVAGVQAQDAQTRQLGSWSQIIPAAMNASGLRPWFASQGMTRQQIDACLTNEAAFNELMTIKATANAMGVQGTPTFFLNGNMVPTSDWASLQTLLDAS